MSCRHCKDTIRPVTIDESLSRMITLQATRLKSRTATIRHMVNLIRLGQPDDAFELGDAFIRSQKFQEETTDNKG